MYYTPELMEQAEKMITECLDYIELDNGLLLCAYGDGVWVCDAKDECDMNKFDKLECITEKTWG